MEGSDEFELGQERQSLSKGLSQNMLAFNVVSKQSENVGLCIQTHKV